MFWFVYGNEVFNGIVFVEFFFGNIDNWYVFGRWIGLMIDIYFYDVFVGCYWLERFIFVVVL